MGLDSVELVMEIEKAFGIRIPDAEAEKMYTVNDMYNCVWKHISERQSNRSNPQMVFYRLREQSINRFNIQKEKFTSVALLNQLIPLNNRRKIYADLEEAVALDLPPLILTKKWSAVLASIGMVTIGSTLMTALVLTIFLNRSGWLFMMPVAGTFLTLFISFLLKPKRTVVSPDSMQAYVKSVVALNHLRLSKTSGTNRKEVENVINHIIVDKIGIDMEEISPEKSFTDDLGVD